MVNADLRRRHQQSSNDNDDALLQPCFGIASGAGRSRQAALLFLLIAGSSMVLPCVRAFTASTSQRSRLINRNKSLVRTPRFLPPVPLSYGAIDSLEKRPPVSSLISSSCCSTRLFSTTSSSTSIHTTITAKSTTTTTITKAVDLKHVDYCNHVVTPFAEGTSAGSTPKPPAIFLHGLLGNKRNFASIGKSLSQQIHHPRRIVGLDLRNHGAFLLFSCVLIGVCLLAC